MGIYAFKAIHAHIIGVNAYIGIHAYIDIYAYRMFHAKPPPLDLNHDLNKGETYCVTGSLWQVLAYKMGGGGLSALQAT